MDHCADQACNHDEPPVYKECCFSRIYLDVFPDPFDVESALQIENELLTSSRPCPRCNFSFFIERSTHNINLPEVLIVYIARYIGKGEFVDTPIREHIVVPTTGPDERESYTLQAVAMSTNDAY